MATFRYMGWESTCTWFTSSWWSHGECEILLLITFGLLSLTDLTTYSQCFDSSVHLHYFITTVQPHYHSSASEGVQRVVVKFGLCNVVCRSSCSVHCCKTRYHWFYITKHSFEQWRYAEHLRSWWWRPGNELQYFIHTIWAVQVQEIANPCSQSVFVFM